MWDDAKIGKGEYGCSAVKIFSISKGNVSENRVSYWITDCICEMGMVVMKDTREGQKITDMIANGIVDDRLQDYFDKILLKRVSPANLKLKIQQTIDDAYDKGKEMKADEIRSALGVRDYY